MRESDKLELTLLSEQNTLEYWLVQISLSGELGISDKIQKRLNWVTEKLQKIAEVNASIPITQSGKELREDKFFLQRYEIFKTVMGYNDSILTHEDIIDEYLKSNQ